MNLFSQRAAVSRGSRTADAQAATATAGLTGGSIAMGAMLAFGLGAGVFLATAKPLYALGAAAGGLFIGSALHSETA